MTAPTRRPTPWHNAPDHHRRVGQRLTALRHDARLSQVEFGRLVGKSQNRIARLEKGRTRLRLLKASVFAEVLGVSIRAFDPDTAWAPGAIEWPHL